MAGSFDIRHDSATQRRAVAAYISVLLDEALPALRLAAKGCGYALAVHGSQARDIDLVAIPWVDGAQDADKLSERLCGVLAGILGRATTSGDWVEKPHGRRAKLIYTPGPAEIDLSVMPIVAKKKDEAE